MTVFDRHSEDPAYGGMSEDADGDLILMWKDSACDPTAAPPPDVALNHTAGLSLPQQVQILPFAGYCLLDTDQHDKQQAQAPIPRRIQRLGMSSATPCTRT